MRIDTSFNLNQKVFVIAGTVARPKVKEGFVRGVTVYKSPRYCLEQYIIGKSNTTQSDPDANEYAVSEVYRYKSSAERALEKQKADANGSE